MIFEAQKARSPSALTSSLPTVRPQLQRKCACGGTPGPTGECADCRRKRKAMQTKLRINQPGDRYEQEADRVAAAVVGGTSSRPAISSLGNGAAIQREEPKTPPKPNNYDEAAKKIAAALAETQVAKDLKAQAAELGKDFIQSVEGKIIAGSALGGALAAIIASNSELPMQIPEVPLDFIAPGLKATLVYEGPVQKPTSVSLKLTSKSGASVTASYSSTEASGVKPAEQKGGLTLSIPLGESAAKKKGGPTDAEKYRAETARIAAGQEKFREGLKTPKEKAEEQSFVDSYVRSRNVDATNPLGLPPLKKKEDSLLMRKEAHESAASAVAPPAVDEVLAQSGQPLDRTTRSLMEARFGYDFGHVRLHADGPAAASARAVDALAYTVGHHVVFAAGSYQQSTSAGQRLLAHELVHTIQQGAGATPLSSSVPHPARERTAAHSENSHGSAPAASVAGTIQRQPAPPPITPTDASVCRIHFEHARAEFTDAKEFDRCLKAARDYLKGNPATQVALYGYASEEGDTKFNEDLAQRRADTVQKLMGVGGLPRGRILAFGRGEDKSLPTLPENRRVELVPFQKVDIPEDKITAPKPVVPTHFCGPNVTKPVGDSVAKIKTDFRKLSADEKNTSCDWLRDEVYGLISWDIRPLHQQSWIKNDYGKTCAQPLEGDGVCCHRSVQIGDACHYAGSVNYVSFGAMCRECFNHYATTPVDLSGVYNFREQSMVDLIELYKGGHLPFTTRASNVENSKKWASAGYQGWPSGGSPPKADCAECAPCPTQYVGKEFDARWCPYLDPKKACPENRAQVLKEESRDARGRRKR